MQTRPNNTSLACPVRSRILNDMHVLDHIVHSCDQSASQGNKHYYEPLFQKSVFKGERHFSSYLTIMLLNTLLAHQFNCLKFYIRKLCIATATWAYLIGSGSLSFAANLGQHGAVFGIEEQDLLTVIESRLRAHEESGALAEFTSELEDEMRAYATKPKGIKLPVVSENRTRKLDPTVFLNEDIIVDNKLLYPKGTIINPLEHMRFQKLVFIDGHDEEQASFARQIASEDMNATIILVNGKPGLHIINNNEYFYYFDQAGVYAKRFNIERVPSIVYQANEEKVLTIHEVSLRGSK